ncbi:MAG: efflux system, outer rane lipoprotein NodT family [Edaphobacter sp.]|nr:efflux system, outer rane lipoprotein NodT family [Edaphobacter sp.]
MRRINGLSVPVTSLAFVLLSGCMVGPKYTKPPVPMAPGYKEAPPTSFKADNGWKVSHPCDSQLKGNWWELFGDPQLDALEARVDGANQTLKMADANFRAARANVGYYRASEAPTIGVAPSISAVRDSANQPYLSKTIVNGGTGNFALPLELNYEVDLWGRIHRQVTAAREQEQASAADVANTRLSLHAELAIDYMEVRSADAQIKLLFDTVKAYTDAVNLTRDRFEGGASPLSDLTQARTQLDSARVLETDISVTRAQYEHAIAILVGVPPAQFALAPTPLNLSPPKMPDIPGTLPSQLLERRPDIASSERQMAASNEQIGIAQAAYYPTLSLSALAGLQGTSALNWFSWPSRFWAVGPTFSETLFDAGRRRAVRTRASANYDAAVASYRQTTLTAFQQVEDNLAALRILETEAQQQHESTASAEQSLDLSQTRYEGGVDTYLQVITWQTAALSNERNDIDIMRRRMEASVVLIKALGGGWNTTQLP